jgi:Arm domain-containing DNA-binding protein
MIVQRRTGAFRGIQAARPGENGGINAHRPEGKTGQATREDYKLADSGGLHLFVTTRGFRAWRMKYRFAGKEKRLTLGPLFGGENVERKTSKGNDSAAVARAESPVSQLRDQFVPTSIHTGPQIAPERLFHPRARGPFQIRSIAVIDPRPELIDARLERNAANRVDLAITGGPPRPTTHLAPANGIARAPSPQPLTNDDDFAFDVRRMRGRGGLARRQKQ